MVEIDNKQETQVKANRRGNPNWVKGMRSPNPKGNTRSKDLAGLIEALDNRAKREKYKDFDALVADRAVQYETVLIAVMKKVYPEQSSVPTVNIYTQIWNGFHKKAQDVDSNGRVHIARQAEVPK